MTNTYTVQSLTATIRDLLELDPDLQDVWVEGEVSNFTRAASGHLYFTLKDATSELRCVMWRSQAERLRTDPQHGDAVLAHGRITVYDARGQYQLMCDSLQAAGIGDLNRQFELLKARLEAEGLFDSDRKRTLPTFPTQIGVVTSPTTAAFQDIQNVIRRRYPGVDVVLSPTLVQGQDAPPQIVAAIERLNAHSTVDVILVARGGGSLEDLWCFNDEAVVRAVAASRIPVVTGVGHEIDFTLVDFAADVRAPTPSAAAELITPDGAALRLALGRLVSQMDDAVQDKLAFHRGAVDSQVRLLGRLSPRSTVERARLRLDDRRAWLDQRVTSLVERRRDRLAARQRSLEQANPSALLARGYVRVTRTGDGQRVTSAHDAAEGTSLHLAFRDGDLTARVVQRALRPAEDG